MPVPYGRGCYKRIRNRKSVKGWKDDGYRLQKIAVYKRREIKGVLCKTAVTRCLVQKVFIYLFYSPRENMLGIAGVMWVAVLCLVKIKPDYAKNISPHRFYSSVPRLNL